MKPLSNNFFKQEILDLAKNLLNKYLILKTKTKEKIITKIVEVEAYSHIEKGSHSYKNKKTNKNKSMFLEQGHLYVYKIYGLYYCLNIVANKKEIGDAVLIRALEPINNIKFLEKNRPNKNLLNLTNGPSKLCLALNIDKTYDGINIKNNKQIYLATNNKYEIDEFISIKKTNDYELLKTSKQHNIIVACKRINIESALNDKLLY